MAVTSLPTIVQDLPDALLSNVKRLGQRRYRLTSLVTGTDFSVTSIFGKGTIGDGRLRENQAAIRNSHCEGYGEQHLGE